MKLLRPLIVFLCLFGLIVCSDVQNLTSETFNQTISKYKYVMVKFYAPWCMHCKNMVPEYEKLAEMLKDQHDLVVADVDASTQTELAERYELEGYPSIKLFINQIPITYNGQRKTDQMYAWIKKVLEKKLEKITQQQINNLSEKQAFVVYFGKDPEKQKILEVINLVDAEIKYYQCPQYKDERIVLYVPKKQPLEYQNIQQVSVDKIKQWYLVNTLPTVIPLSTRELLDFVFYNKESEKDAAMLLREDDMKDETFAKLEKLCNENKNKLKCCFADKSMQIYLGVKNYVRSKGESVLVYTKDTLKQAYKYPHSLEEISEQSWKNFLSQIKEKKHTNLASVESDQLEYEYAKVLTDENYTDFVESNEMVLVQFVSFGCAECVDFSDDYDALAKEIYDGNRKIQVAAIDLKRNKQTGFKLKIFDYPSFRLYVSGSYIDYQGNRTKQDLLAFIDKVENQKLNVVTSIQEVPAPAVVLYDSSQSTPLRLLPIVSSRYPLYQIKEGTSPRIILKLEQKQKTYPIEQKVNLHLVHRWVERQFQPVLVNLLVSRMGGKLKDAIENQIHMLCLFDVQEKLSQKLRQTLTKYCQDSELVCGYAKKGEDHFNQLMQWADITDEVNKSMLVYVNTQSFAKYALEKENIEQMSTQDIEKFISDIKQQKLMTIKQIKTLKEAESSEQNQTNSQTQETESSETDKSQTESQQL